MQILQQPLTPELKNKIYDGFREYAIERVGQHGIRDPIAFVAMEGSECIGAVVAQPFWGALHVKYVWVAKSHRRQGLAKNLLEDALDYGRKQNHPFAFVETMSFQALEFYKKMGFILEFTRGGYADGLKFHYLKRDIDAVTRL